VRSETDSQSTESVAVMRPYRGLPIDDKDFIYGWYFERAGAAYIIPITDKYHTPASFVLTFVQVIPETVGQQTGLKDKNKKEGYVGDIIAFNVIKAFGTDIRYKGEVYFCEKRLAYCVKGLPAWDMLIKHNVINIEIIGTIHDKE